MPQAPGTKYILLDTNCFLRIYCSPVIPLLGRDVEGYRLLTLGRLIDEFKANPRLVATFTNLGAPPKSTDLENGALRLRNPKKGKVEARKAAISAYARMFIQGKNARGASLTPLSPEDVELLATSIVLKGVLATDEKALTELSRDLIDNEDEEDAPSGTMNSFDVLHLLERNNLLTADQRRNTVSTWLRINTMLPAGWRNYYQTLFGESADEL
ncbi:hypothetical protein RJO15_26365 [Herbaspirillum huttiense F1]|uniref:hypothetical protein n=1 Tax=Herbaspirillum huttiense TaxID=863372 RepID=UPI0028846549|nr:hypothetical protein [Herbaspirillum huttiense]MDT0359336.1 hypothetical protein [Herbaspirillum huttiense F1]